MVLDEKNIWQLMAEAGVRTHPTQKELDESTGPLCMCFHDVGSHGGMMKMSRCERPGCGCDVFQEWAPWEDM